MRINEPFGGFPKLETGRLKLRELNIRDAARIFSYFSQGKVTEFYDIDVFASKKQVADLIEALFLRYATGKQIRWAIEYKQTGELIGTCGFHEIEREHWKAEIGYDLDPLYWGRGIMTEVIKEVIRYGFNEMELNRIEAFYDPRNVSSRRVLEKNGFILEGILKKRFVINGQYADAAISAILKEDYRTNG